MTGATVVASLRSQLPMFRQILRESMPVLVVALVLSTLAGIAVEKQLAIFAALPALLVLQPAFVSSAGALGGILSSRVATNLHLGLVQPEMRPGREARRDALLVLLIGFPVYRVQRVGRPRRRRACWARRARGWAGWCWRRWSVGSSPCCS